MPMIAYAMPSGLIGLSPRLPAEGALPIAAGDPGELYAVITSAIRAANGKKLLVPGMQNAETHGQKLLVMESFSSQVAARLAERGGA